MSVLTEMENPHRSGQSGCDGVPEKWVWRPPLVRGLWRVTCMWHRHACGGGAVRSPRLWVGAGACTEGPLGKGAPFILNNTQQNQLGIGEGSGIPLPENLLSFSKTFGARGCGLHVPKPCSDQFTQMSFPSCHGSESQSHPALEVTSHVQEERPGDINRCWGVGGQGAGPRNPHLHQRQTTPTWHVLPLHLILIPR